MLNKTVKTGNMLTATAALFVVAAMLLAAGTAQAASVTIGDPGNDADDAVAGYGKVDYTYSISKDELSEGDLYDANSSWGASGSDAPAASISLYGAMEYANALTEEEHGGSDQYNVYTVEDSDNDPNTGDSDGYDSYSINYSRDEALNDGNLVYAVPTEDEWYKAAYYNVGEEKYYDYAIPDSELRERTEDGTTGDYPPVDGENIAIGHGWQYGQDESGNKYFGSVRDVGEGGLEQNGTRNMMGNVWEWVEDTDGMSRGGYYQQTADALSSSSRKTYDPTNESPNFGFRVVAIPEPASGALFVLVGGLLWFVRRRARA